MSPGNVFRITASGCSLGINSVFSGPSVHVFYSKWEWSDVLPIGESFSGTVVITSMLLLEGTSEGAPYPTSKSGVHYNIAPFLCGASRVMRTVIKKM